MATFPSRLVESQVLEYLRCDVLAELNNATGSDAMGKEQRNSAVSFVNEFLEGLIGVIVRVIDRDAALIRRLMRDQKANDETEERNEGNDRPFWDEKGLIPLIFSQIDKECPQ